MFVYEILFNTVGVLVVGLLLAILIIVIVEAWQHQKLRREPMTGSEIMYFHMSEMNESEVLEYKKRRGK